MIERLAKQLVAWQIRKEFLAPDDRSLYEYAYGLLIGQAVNFLISCLLAVLFHAYGFVAIYLLAYIPLRSYAGGHHAASYGVCTVISTGILAAACMASKIISPEALLYINLCFTAIGGYILFRFVPVETPQKPLDLDERKHYRKRSIQIWSIEICAGALFYVWGKTEVSLAIFLAHVTLIVLLCIGIWKNKRIGS